MTWEQKLVAIQELSPKVSLCMDSPGKWFVRAKGVYIVGRKGGDHGTSIGQFATPEAAVDALWEYLTDVAPPHVIMTNSFETDRDQIRVRWNGSAWFDVPKP